MCEPDHLLSQESKEAEESQMRKWEHTFTVFTPTFNRAHTLHRVYSSLKYQTFQDFEWLIVDDGSTDNTKALINQWKKDAIFDIRYYEQNNSGKHVAINRGVSEAKGEFFLILDSDDSCIPETLEIFARHWNSIPEDARQEFSGVSVLCMDLRGEVVGNEYPQDICDLSPLEMLTKYKIMGEKWGFHRTEVFREFPFPEIPGENFVTEGIVWNRMAARYKVRHVNEKLRIYEYMKDGLSDCSVRIRVKNPLGAKLYYQEFLAMPTPVKWRLKNLINYVRFSLHADIAMKRILLESGHGCLSVFSMPIGYLLYRHDLGKINHCS